MEDCMVVESEHMMLVFLVLRKFVYRTGMHQTANLP